MKSIKLIAGNSALVEIFAKRFNETGRIDEVPFTYTTKIYKISLDILVIFIVYNSIKFSILKKTYKRLKILSGNATLETAVIYGFYE